jgi:hypothetical protein
MMSDLNVLSSTFAPSPMCLMSAERDVIAPTRPASVPAAHATKKYCHALRFSSHRLMVVMMWDLNLLASSGVQTYEDHRE